MRLQVRSAQRNAELNGYSEDAFRVLQCGQSLDDDEPVLQVRGGGQLLRVPCDEWWGVGGEGVCSRDLLWCSVPWICSEAGHAGWWPSGCPSIHYLMQVATWMND